MPSNSGMPERSYGCTFGCGNPYDYIIVSAVDNSVEMLCIPCYIKVAADMVAAITDTDNPDVMAALQSVAVDNAEAASGPKGKPRGHNAPSGFNDPDILEVFDSVITTEDLPDEFR